MNTRMQVTLSAEQHRKAKQKAAAAGLSLAEYIRRVVADDLEDTRPRGDVSAVFALIDTEDSDIAANKDRYVAEAVRDVHSGGRR